MNDLNVFGTTITVNENGLFSLNDAYMVALYHQGGVMDADQGDELARWADNRTPRRFMECERAKALMFELRSRAATGHSMVSEMTDKNGFFVCEGLLRSYLAWFDPCVEAQVHFALSGHI